MPITVLGACSYSRTQPFLSRHATLLPILLPRVTNQPHLARQPYNKYSWTFWPAQRNIGWRYLPANCYRQEGRNLQLEVNFFFRQEPIPVFVNGNANFSVRRQCLYRLSYDFKFNLEFICLSVFFKKVSNGQKFTTSKLVIKTSPQRNSIGTTLEPSLTRNLKVANKDCGA